MSSQGVPNSDDFDSLLAPSDTTTSAATDLTSYSDDLEAQRQLVSESKRVNHLEGVVVQHRSWRTREVFRSEPFGLSSPGTMPVPFMASSPPASPEPQKRKLAEIDLGRNILARPAKAQRTYYGIDIHRLLDEAQAEEVAPSQERVELPTPPSEHSSKRSSLLWSEKYRARKFTDLIGDERTHRAVMHWLKRWDKIVFPGSHRPKAKAKGFNDNGEERPFKKILMLAGPPGLGKTTLAHVCAKQAGYEAQEINASDERSSSVVKGRIRDMLGTETVKGVDVNKTGQGKVRKAGKPVCVIVDEVDGVVTGSGGSGEGGFIKALIDLLTLDQKNSSAVPTSHQGATRKKQGDNFRMQRPLILICNDVYHPSLRPLRQSSHAEVIHVRKAPVQTLISRLQAIFDKEGVPCESDGVRRLCEATWGVSNRKEDRHGNGAGEGDMRGIMVVGEWVARKLRAANEKGPEARLTRRWVEDHVLRDLSHGGGAVRGLGRGGPKDIVERVFQEGAGFPKSAVPLTPDQKGSNFGVKGVAEGLKRTAGERLRELVDTHGDTDRIMTDCFSTYPEHTFQDDTFLSKPDAAYEWLHFHDTLSSAVFSSNEWELAPYLSSSVLAFHHLFASPTRGQYIAPTNDDAAADEPPPHPFIGAQASWAAHEATKHSEALLQTLQSSLSPDLSRAFISHSTLSTDLLPYLLRMVSPNINPVVVGGGSNSTDRGTASVRRATEQQLVARSVNAMAACGLRFDRTRVQADDHHNSGNSAHPAASTQWIYRMEPSLDELGLYPTGGPALAELVGAGAGAARTRFAVRQVLDDEWRREEKRRAEAARMARFAAGHTLVGGGDDDDGAPGLLPRTAGRSGALTGADGTRALIVKRDFFGRPVAVPAPETLAEKVKGPGKGGAEHETGGEGRVWVTFHEGFSNAVRKPITLAELLRGL